jgi:hypothetical protein
MTKKQLVEQEIVKVEKELERLKLLLHSVSGSALEVCPHCKTKNRHWYPKDNWCCAFC